MLRGVNPSRCSSAIPCYLFGSVIGEGPSFEHRGAFRGGASCHCYKTSVAGNTTSLCETIWGFVDASSIDGKRSIAHVIRVAGGQLEDQLDTEEISNIVGEPTVANSIAAAPSLKAYVLPLPTDTSRALGTLAGILVSNQEPAV